jgi:cobalt-zinc-cadmium efflux system membrane fusion protein
VVERERLFAPNAENAAAPDENASQVDPPAPATVHVDSRSVRAAGIEIEPVRALPMENTISCPGGAAFNANRYVEIPPKADGSVRRVLVDVGDHVSKGDVLAVVSSDPVGEVKGAYLKALVHEEHLQWQVESLKAAGQGIPAKALFETEHLLKEQRTDTKRILHRLHYFGLSDADIQQIADSQDPSADLNVLSPIDGTVVNRHAVEGEPVQATSSLFSVAQLTKLWVNLKCYENQLSAIRLGQPVTFFPDGLPGHGFSGTVTWISAELDRQTRTVQLRAEVDNPSGLLKANMFGRAQITLDQPQERLVVPQNAVQMHGGGHYVFVQEGHDTFRARPIQLGQRNAEVWEVTSGLTAGEKVATVGSFLLKSNLENPEFGNEIE